MCDECYAAIPREPAPRPKPVKDYKPGTRQAGKTPDRASGELPWWAKTRPGEMTKTAKERERDMSNSSVGRQLKNDKNLGR